MTRYIGTEIDALKLLVDALYADNEGVIAGRGNCRHSSANVIMAVTSVEECTIRVWKVGRIAVDDSLVGSVNIVSGNGPVEQFSDWSFMLTKYIDRVQSRCIRA